jgi:sodium-dependent dicarboxylate transporter 2/3/5
MATEKKQQSNTIYVIKLLIGLFLMFGFGFLCPSWGGIAQQGLSAIGIFIGAVFLIATGCGLIPVCCMGLVACYVSGFYDAKSLLSATFGSGTLVQLFFCYALCQALIDSGAGETFAKWVITRKAIQGHPFLFHLAFMLAVLILCGFVDTIGGIVLAYTIEESIRRALGYEEDSNWSMMTILGLHTAAIFGAAALPFKGVPLTIFSAITTPLAELGFEINYAIYIFTIFCAGIVYTVLYNVLFFKVFKVDVSRLKNFDVNSVEGMSNQKFNKSQVIIASAVILCILYSVILLILPKETAFYTFFSGLGQPLWFALLVALLCLIKVDKKPIVNAKHLFSEIPWGVALAVALFTAVGAMLSNADLGVRGWLQQLLSPIFGGMPFLVFMFVMVCVSIIITNFFSNMATGVIIGAIVSPFVVTYAVDFNVNGSAIGAALVAACFFAFMTMPAAAHSPLLHSRPEFEKNPSFIWRRGSVCCLLAAVVITLVSSFFAFIF